MNLYYVRDNILYKLFWEVVLNFFFIDIPMRRGTEGLGDEKDENSSDLAS